MVDNNITQNLIDDNIMQDLMADDFDRFGEVEQLARVLLSACRFFPVRVESKDPFDFYKCLDGDGLIVLSNINVNLKYELFLLFGGEWFRICEESEVARNGKGWFTEYYGSRYEGDFVGWGRCFLCSKCESDVLCSIVKELS